MSENCTFNQKLKNLKIKIEEDSKLIDKALFLFNKERVFILDKNIN